MLLEWLARLLVKKLAITCFLNRIPVLQNFYSNLPGKAKPMAFRLNGSISIKHLVYVVTILFCKFFEKTVFLLYLWQDRKITFLPLFFGNLRTTMSKPHLLKILVEGATTWQEQPFKLKPYLQSANNRKKSLDLLAGLTRTVENLWSNNTVSRCENKCAVLFYCW